MQENQTRFTQEYWDALEAERLERIKEEEICRRIDEYDLSVFDSPDLKGSGEDIHPELLRKLVEMEMLLERKVDINSGVRTKRWNNILRKRGLKAVLNSAHIHKYAADIRIHSSQERMEVLEAALEVGFSRIGVGKTFVHVDVDPDKPQETLWTY